MVPLPAANAYGLEVIVEDSKLSDRVIAGTWDYVTSGGTTNTGNAVRALAFPPDGKTLVANQSGTVRFWNATTGTLLAGLNGTTENFVRIGHSLLALVMALFGGCLSGRLYGREVNARSG